MLASSPEFYQAAHTKQEYMEKGPSICRHNPVSFDLFCRTNSLIFRFSALCLNSSKHGLFQPCIYSIFIVDFNAK